MTIILRTILVHFETLLVCVLAIHIIIAKQCVCCVSKIQLINTALCMKSVKAGFTVIAKPAENESK